MLLPFSFTQHIGIVNLNSIQTITKHEYLSLSQASRMKKYARGTLATIISSDEIYPHFSPFHIGNLFRTSFFKCQRVFFHAGSLRYPHIASRSDTLRTFHYRLVRTCTFQKICTKFAHISFSTLREPFKYAELQPSLDSPRSLRHSARDLLTFF